MTRSFALRDKTMRTNLITMLLVALVFLAGRAAAQERPPVEASSPARVHGRLVDDAGRPIAEAVLLVRGYPRPLAQAATTTPTARRLWKQPVPAVTGADGRFKLSFEALADHQFRLELDRPGFERMGWRWSSLAQGAEVALGDVVLRPAAALVVHIVDKDGGLLVDGWFVSARPLQLPPDSDPAVWPATNVIDRATGACRIGGLPAGWVTVSARTRGLESIPEQRVSLESTLENTVELVYTGTLERDLVRVELRRSPGCPIEPQTGSVRAIGEDGTAVVMRRHQGPTNIWFAEPRVEGPHTIVVDDARFLPVALEHVGVGRLASCALIGSAALVLDVVDEVDGAPVHDHGLAVQYHSELPPSGRELIFEPGQRGAATGQPIALVPGEVSLHLSSPRHPSTQVRLAPIAAGETRTVRIVLSAPVTLRGLVVDSSGAPVSGAVVLLTQGTEHGHDEGGQAIVFTSRRGSESAARSFVPYRDHRVESGADGRFSVEGLARGHWAAHAAQGPFVHCTDVRELGAGSTEWRLVLPESTRATFALTGLGLRTPSRYFLSVYADDSTPVALRAPAHIGLGLALPADAEGHFGPVRLPIGPLGVCVLEDRSVGTGTRRVSAWQGTVEVTPGLFMNLDVASR